MSTNQNNKYIKSTDQDEKRYLLLKKPNSYSLSKYKLVHSREQDIVDTLIVRNTWSKANLNKFSVKGIVLIQNIFYGMLTLLCEHEDEILSTLKYDDTNELVVLLESLNEKDILNMQKWSDVEKHNPENKFQVNYIDGLAQHIELLQADDDGTIVNGVQLFIGETLKLIQYIVNRYDFVEGEARFNEWKDECTINNLYQRLRVCGDSNFYL